MANYRNKPAKKPAGNMALGPLKGATDGKERKRRLEAAIDEQTGAPKKKKKK